MYAVGRKTRKWVTYEYFENLIQALKYSKYLKRINQFDCRYFVKGEQNDY